MKPMLAAATDGSALQYPLLTSPKFDGVRCLIVNGIAMSRSLKPIPNLFVQHLFGRTEFSGLDGELIIGKPNAKDVYQRTVSGVMTRSGDPEIAFYVFDDFSAFGTFERRLAVAKRRVRVLSCAMPVHHELILTLEQLLAFEETCLIQGFEGVMLRDPAGPYKPGRSTLKEEWLLKLKRFVDSEAKILGVKQLMHNANEATTNELGQKERSSHKAGKVAKELLGAFIVKDLKSKVEFEIGTGFTLEQRQWMWKDQKKLVGKLVKYKFQPVGVKDKPRFPVFLGFRELIDLG